MQISMPPAIPPVRNKRIVPSIEQRLQEQKEARKSRLTPKKYRQLINEKYGVDDRTNIRTFPYTIFIVSFLIS